MRMFMAISLCLGWNPQRLPQQGGLCVWGDWDIGHRRPGGSQGQNVCDNSYKSMSTGLKITPRLIVASYIQSKTRSKPWKFRSKQCKALSLPESLLLNYRRRNIHGQQWCRIWQFMDRVKYLEIIVTFWINSGGKNPKGHIYPIAEVEMDQARAIEPSLTTNPYPAFPRQLINSKRWMIGKQLRIWSRNISWWASE